MPRLKLDLDALVVVVGVQQSLVVVVWLVEQQSRVVQLPSSAFASNFSCPRHQTGIASTLDSKSMGRWARMVDMGLKQPATKPEPKLGFVQEWQQPRIR